jgi:hypothetical protein
MIDTETLGLKPGCKILSISAVTFNAKIKRQFDVFIQIGSQVQLFAEEDTYYWWLQQDETLRDFTFNNRSAVPLEAALNMLTAWYLSLPEKCDVWANGANFDFGIIRAAYTSLGLEPPWTYRQEMCYRTLKKQFGYLIREPQFAGIPHRSLHDAQHQANYAEMLLHTIHNLK